MKAHSSKDLPKSTEFWTAINSPFIKTFVNVAIFDEIRSINLSYDHLTLVARVSKLKTLVNLIDDPAAILNDEKSIAMHNAIMEEERALIED